MAQTFSSLLSSISSLKIQGANNVALAGLDALGMAVKTARSKKELTKKINQIVNTRPTEPLLRNIINYCEHQLDYSHLLSSYISARKNTRFFFEEGKNKIISYGKNKIPNNAIIYTHCHSSTVVQIIIKAKKKVKAVNNTETRPLFQGRMTAKDVAKAGIPVEHYVDSAARIALKGAHLVLLGADAITVDGVYNKVGSEMIAVLAKHFKIPLYVCAHSWKYDNQAEFGFEETIEKRHAKEVWSRPPKNVHINNYAFERIDFELITGIITELGILPPTLFLEEIKRKYGF